MSTIPIIAGLYRRTQCGRNPIPYKILNEIKSSLKINGWYKDEFLFLAGDTASARDLEAFGLEVYRVFDDAPMSIMRDAVQKMKHWMCYWAIRQFGEVVWVDWDTISLRQPDQQFWDWCHAHDTPKFVYIPNYWATVNSSVYYAPVSWAEAMERSFRVEVSKPNDELLWAAVLPSDVRERPEYWWGKRAVNIWTPEECKDVDEQTYFAHVRYFSYAGLLKKT